MAGRALPFPVEERLRRPSRSPVRMFWTWKSGEPRSPSLTFWRRKCARSCTCASVRLGARRSRSAAVPLLQERPELAAVAIAQHDDRAHEVRALVAAARLRAVAVDALARPHLAPAVGGRRRRPPACRSARRPASMPPPPRPGGGPPWRPPAGGGPCGACAAEIIAPAAISTAIANPFVIVALATVPARRLFAQLSNGTQPWLRGDQADGEAEPRHSPELLGNVQLARAERGGPDGRCREASGGDERLRCAGRRPRRPACGVPFWPAGAAAAGRCPAASTQRSAQWPMASSAGASARPLAVSEYSTRTGVSGMTVRATIASSSSSRRRSESIRSVMSGMAVRSSAYRDGRCRRIWMIAPGPAPADQLDRLVKPRAQPW